jgi:hypothetical protein
MPTYNTGAFDLNEGDQVDFQSDADGNLKVAVTGSSALPTGAATAARQDTLAALFPARSLSIPVGAQTYAAAFSGYAAYATPTDLFSLIGSATKTVAVINMSFGIQSTASALQTLDLIRRSAANTGGTATTLTAALHDSTQAAATAVAKIWTAAPALGASAGILKSIVAASTTLALGPTLLGTNFTNWNAPSPLSADDFRRPIILRGVAESLNLNYRGAALTAGFVACGFVEWIEF